MFFLLRKCLVLAILSMYLMGSYGQSSNLNFQTLDNSSGLPNNFINDIEMDSLGFLWIATVDGLCRYDSPSQIQVYKSGDLGLQASNISTIKAGRNNKLWIGTHFGGVTMYDIQADTSKTYNNAEEDTFKFTNNEILSICEIDSNEIWVGTENGLNVLYTDTDSIYQFPIDIKSDSEITAKAILDISVDKNGWIWVSTWEGSYYLYTPSKSGKHSEGKFRKLKIREDVKVNSIWKVFQDSRGLYWIASHNGGAHIMMLPEDANNDPLRQDWEPTFHSFNQEIDNDESISSNYINSFAEDDYGNIWISTTHGLNIVNEAEVNKLMSDTSSEKINLKFKRQYQNFLKNSLANSLLTKIYRDKQGIMWVGSISGLNQYNWYTNQFDIVKLPTSTDEITSSQDQLINSISLQDDNTLLLASNVNGIISYDIKNEEITETNKYLNPTFSNRISTIRQIGDELYIGVSNGINVFNIKTNKIIRNFDFPLLENNDANYFITHIFKDSKARLWVGTEIGLLLIYEEENKFKWFTNSISDPTSISDNSITNTFEDTQNNIWISTFNGLNKLVESNDSLTFKKYKRGESDYSIPSNKITSINEYDGLLYFGSRNGIFTYDLAKQTFKLLDIDQNKQSVNNIQISNQGAIWASTAEGILHYEIKTKEYKLYGRNDGIGDMSFRVAAGCISGNNDVYFGGNKGFIRINDSALNHNSKKPDVFITQVKTINTDNEQTVSGIKRESIVLPANNYYLEINFTGLNYNQAEYNQYKYKLIGFSDEGWQTNNTQKAIYTNLDPGKYTFKVIAANNEGVWNNEGVSLNIEVKAALVETKWFKLLLLLLTILFGWLAFNLYTKNIRNKNVMLEDYNEKLNTQIQKTEAANSSLEEREKYMRVLLKKLEYSNEELLRSNKDLEEFAYAASHDMKEPLRTVGTFTNLLNKKYNDKLGSSGKEYIDFITQGVDRMSDLINSLLSYSQVGKKDIEIQYCDLNEIVNSKIKDLTQIIAERNVSILCDDLPKILCAGNQIGMVFYNLILNGIKFNKTENPRIEISAIDDSSHWKFSVKDNGIGIPAKYQKQIFEIFKRLHNRDEYEGTGIGLALCNKIILRHNGQISVDSVPNVGTTFSFTISKNIQLTNEVAKEVNISTQPKNSSPKTRQESILKPSRKQQ